MSDPLSNQYAENHYRSFVHTKTHPRAIAAQARLFGIACKTEGSLRILEVGCNDGANLLSMAEALPEASFLGLDLTSSQIEKARKSATKKGITNVQFEAINLLHFEPGAQKFDYIIAHGFFSWVPQEVQSRLLELCRDSLKPEGLALLSYNVLPGAQIQDALRQLYTLEISSAETDGKRLSESGRLDIFDELFGFFKEAATAIPDNASHLKTLSHGLSHLQNKSNILVHDEGGEFWEAFYFLEFNQIIEGAGLSYVIDADIVKDWVEIYPKAIRDAMTSREMPRLKALQYADYLFNTNFRSSILCPNSLASQITSRPDLDTMKDFSIVPLASFEQTSMIHPTVAEALRGLLPQTMGQPLAVQTVASVCAPELSYEQTCIELLKAQGYRAIILWA